MNVERICARLAAAGLDLGAGLPGDEYDALVPEPWRISRVAAGARSVLIVGNAGRTLWTRFRASPEARLELDPLDRYTRRVLCEVSRQVTPPLAFACYRDVRAGLFLPLMRLAQRAGLGSPGRVGVLIHPRYGPWIALRAALFLREEVAFTPPPAFDPCTDCPAPCQRACHGGVVSHAGVETVGCLRMRVEHPACRIGCDARRACVIGPEHAYDAEQTAHHSAS